MNTRTALPRITTLLVSLACLAANAAVPTDITGLALWLKADAGIRTNASGSITNWVDQSHAGIVLTNLWPQSSASGPLLTNNWANGKPAVRFQKAAISGPETNVLVVPSGSLSITQNQARTLFMVVRLTHVPSGVNNELIGTHTGTQIAIGD